jgi:hypothetical protein
MPDGRRITSFELRHLASGATIHVYVSEAAALAFVRDVIRVRGHHDAARFGLSYLDECNVVQSTIEAGALVARALEDRVL